jgi:hypothetical protein
MWELLVWSMVWPATMCCGADTAGGVAAGVWLVGRDLCSLGVEQVERAVVGCGC